ncbi:MAG TPA: hypothetical protein VGO11_01170 [Chthoniobacteraceae bacterium]|jgi:hypothetical protein|nr:hypothetical protein [Chthoniobacteraceae bacterium]
MNNRPSHHPSARRLPSKLTGCAALGLLLVSCATRQTASTDLDAPIFGPSHPTTYIVAPTDDVVHARDLAKVARILRRYKTLEAAERALVKSSVAKRLNGLIALEVQRVEVRHRAERAEISRLPDRAEAAKRLAALNETIRREATENVIKRLGNLVAVPLKTSDNRSAVAFARIGGKTIEVAADAGELDRPIASLIEGERVQTEVGRTAAFMEAAPTAVAASR